MISFTKALSFFATMLVATADPIREPARLLINADLLKTVFHSGDQRILDVFDNLFIGEVEQMKDDRYGFPNFKLSEMYGSVKTDPQINLDDYDFDISLNDPEFGFFGLQGRNLRFVGKGKYNDNDFTFEAPISVMRIEIEMLPDDDEEVAKLNKNALMPVIKEFKFEFGEVTMNFSDGEADERIKQILRYESESAVRQVYNGIWDGDFAKLGKLPLESFLPLLLLKQIGVVSKTFEVKPHSLEYGFDPEMFYSNERPVFKKKRSMLKEIDSEFTDQEEEADPYAIQIILDENIINAFLLDFVLYEKAFSLREILKLDPKMSPFLEQLNTTNAGMLLPQVIEEFGENRMIDFYLSLSHSLISKKIENAKVSGFQIDKNGNFRFQFNFTATILVEKAHSAGGFEEARSMYVGLTAKGKFLIKETVGDKILVIAPKGAEVSSLKIYDAKDQEMVAEQMMITAGLNVQLETALNMIPPYELPLLKPPSPAELECLGFKLGEIDLKFKKGYLEVMFGYKLVDFPSDKEVCETFLAIIRKGPQDFMEGAKSYIGEDFGSAKDYLTNKRSELDEKIEKFTKTGVKDLPSQEENVHEEL